MKRLPAATRKTSVLPAPSEPERPSDRFAREHNIAPDGSSCAARSREEARALFQQWCEMRREERENSPEGRFASQWRRAARYPADRDRHLGALARDLGRYHSGGSAAQQARSIVEAVSGPCARDDGRGRFGQQDGQLAWQAPGRTRLVRTGPALRTALGEWQLRHGQDLWVTFGWKPVTELRGGRKIRSKELTARYGTEPSAEAYRIAMAAGSEWALSLPELEPAAEVRLTIEILGERVQREMTVSELARAIGWDGTPSALARCLPQMAAQAGMTAERAWNPRTGRPRRDPRTGQAVWKLGQASPASAQVIALKR